MSNHKAHIDGAGSLARTSLGDTLRRWFLLLALVPMLLVAGLGYQQANTSLSQAAADELEQSAELNSRFITNWFEYRFMDLSIQAESVSNSTLLTQLIDGLQQSGKTPQEYVKSFAWARQVDGAQDDLITLSRRYDYIHDLYLIDSQSNILYTVARESDLGTNLVDGRLGNSRFAQSVIRTLHTGQAIFSDLERYAPSNNGIYGFLTAPLLDQNGIILGAFAIQIKVDRIFELMSIAGKRQNTLVHYVVGEDGLLRTPYQQQDQVLTRAINTLQIQLWHADQKPTGQQSDSQKAQAFTYSGPDGRQVIGIHQSLRLPGTNWVLISEIDQDEALATAVWLGRVTLVLVLITGLLAAMLAYFQGAPHYPSAGPAGRG